MTYDKEKLLDLFWEFNLYFTDHSKIASPGSINFAVSPETAEKRMEICRGCDQFDPKRLDCKRCGCYLPNKTEDTGESCPIDRWGADKEGWLSGAKELLEKIENHVPVTD
jgi:hypothetical protein